MKDVFYGLQVRRWLEGLPEEVLKKLAITVSQLQGGQHLKPPLAKPMNIVAAGVSEIRLRNHDGIYRFFYYLKLKEKILIFHAFQKKTQKTPQLEIETARSRLNQMLREFSE